jgi:hypothetical protein
MSPDIFAKSDNAKFSIKREYHQSTKDLNADFSKEDFLNKSINQGVYLLSSQIETESAKLADP